MSLLFPTGGQCCFADLFGVVRPPSGGTWTSASMAPCPMPASGSGSSASFSLPPEWTTFATSFPSRATQATPSSRAIF
eukprot:1194917-Prorocentrum_minimum.AAC.1